MERGLQKVIPDKARAKSKLEMADTTLEMIRTIDKGKYPSNIIKEYYEVIRELISIILLLDGYKSFGEGSHKRLIDYLAEKYREYFTRKQIILIDKLRTIRNRIAYEGFFVREDYIDRKTGEINQIIDKLKKLIKKKL